MKELIAVAGALVAAVSTIPYIIDTVKGRTKPNIVTWFTWTLLTLIAALAAFASHEPKSAYLLLANTFCTGLVVAVGLRYGTAKYSWFDGLCQLGTVAGLVLWLVFNSPTIGIVVPLTIDFIGMLPTLRHSWLKPAEETWQTFLIGVVAPLLTIVSLTRYNIASLLFPLYLFLANAAIVAVVITRRRQLGLSLARAEVGQ
jgi:hypothetical protein